MYIAIKYKKIKMYYFLSEATSRLKIEVDNKIIESGGCLRELALYYYY